MFSPSDFWPLFRPSYCLRRVWLNANSPELAVPDEDFAQLVKEKGLEVEEAHVQSLGPIEEPEYGEYDFEKGFEDTLRLIQSREPIIYQGVLINNEEQLITIPDLLLFDNATQRYILREIKLATNLDSHQEIQLGVGLSKIVARSVLGYEPVIEIVTGDGVINSPYECPPEDVVFQAVKLITSIQEVAEEPFEPVGWSKCSSCEFFSHCWGEAWEKHNICTISGIEQSMSLALNQQGIETWEKVVSIGDRIYDVRFQRGSQIQRIGSTRGGKIIRQACCLSAGKHENIACVQLPQGYLPGKRPIVIFDVENNMPAFEELGLEVDVYLWGLLLITDEGSKQFLIVAPRNEDGDAKGWEQFLKVMSEIFQEYGDLPIIHFSKHERTKVTKYIGAFGDPNLVAQRVLHNLWDLYTTITQSVVLPVPSYGLKSIEKFVGFVRSQKEYGGSWSLVRYNSYLKAESKEESGRILEEIKLYNAEDLLATYAVYEWVEQNCC
ncbi:TM0106 family RecB-like putative nuclease [Dehalogenimonas sp. THU2]|uniref:TM0106 family RecB-like putative nuclease n=1 Tax=Dehalogenimonas sp. THU2 TaxID=3151121 RepID=UPI0032181637